MIIASPSADKLAVNSNGPFYYDILYVEVAPRPLTQAHRLRVCLLQPFVFLEPLGSLRSAF